MARLTAFNWKEAAGGTYAAGGIVKGGDPGISSGFALHEGAGAVQIAYAEDMDIAPSVELEVTGATKTLLLHAFPASYPYGALTQDLILQFGTDTAGWEIGVPALGAADAITDTCCINRLVLSSREGEVARATLEFLALSATRDTNGIAPVALAAGQKPMRHGDATITFATADLTCIAWEATIGLNVTARGPAAARPSGEHRFKTLLDPGIPAVGLTATVLAPAGIDLAADAPAHNLGAVCALTDGTTTITSTFTNLGYRSEAFRLRERDNGLVEWSLDFSAYMDSWSMA